MKNYYLKGDMMKNKCPHCGAKFNFENLNYVEYKCLTKVFCDEKVIRDSACYEGELAIVKGKQFQDEKKWREYERKYILPCFRWAKEVGIDLKTMVYDNPGHNCAELLVKTLLKMVDESEIKKTKQHFYDLRKVNTLLTVAVNSHRDATATMDVALRLLLNDYPNLEQKWKAEKSDNG